MNPTQKKQIRTRTSIRRCTITYGGVILYIAKEITPSSTLMCTVSFASATCKAYAAVTRKWHIVARSCTEWNAFRPPSYTANRQNSRCFDCTLGPDVSVRIRIKGIELVPVTYFSIILTVPWVQMYPSGSARVQAGCRHQPALSLCQLFWQVLRFRMYLSRSV